MRGGRVKVDGQGFLRCQIFYVKIPVMLLAVYIPTDALSNNALKELLLLFCHVLFYKWATTTFCDDNKSSLKSADSDLKYLQTDVNKLQMPTFYMHRLGT